MFYRFGWNFDSSYLELRLSKSTFESSYVILVSAILCWMAQTMWLLAESSDDGKSKLQSTVNFMLQAWPWLLMAKEGCPITFSNDHNFSTRSMRQQQVSDNLVWPKGGRIWMVLSQADDRWENVGVFQRDFDNSDCSWRGETTWRVWSLGD